MNLDAENVIGKESRGREGIGHRLIRLGKRAAAGHAQLVPGIAAHARQQGVPLRKELEKHFEWAHLTPNTRVFVPKKGRLPGDEQR